MTVLVQQVRGVEVQRVTVFATGQVLQRQAKQLPEAGQIIARTIESLEKAREGRIAGDAFDAQQRGRSADRRAIRPHGSASSHRTTAPA